jgi:protein involved in polysaccharide export with SLBB domain
VTQSPFNGISASVHSVEHERWRRKGVCARGTEMIWGNRILGSRMATALVGILGSVLVGCSAEQAVRTNEVPAVSHVQEPAEYRIQPGDELDIKFFYTPELNQTVTVRPDGKVSLQLIDEVAAAGLTPAELDGRITPRYAKEVNAPAITVAVKTSAGRKVYVGGEVKTPGIVDLQPGMTALQAVINAGGFLNTAKPEAALVVRNASTQAPTPIRIDLGQTVNGEAAHGDMPLQPQDIVYVPKTFIAEANVFVTQYIKGLLMFQGWGIDLNPFRTNGN